MHGVVLNRWPSFYMIDVRIHPIFRNLIGDDYTDCSFIFLYILCTMTIRQNLQKALGFAPSRAMNRQSQPNLFGAPSNATSNFSYLRWERFICFIRHVALDWGFLLIPNKIVIGHVHVIYADQFSLPFLLYLFLSGIAWFLFDTWGDTHEQFMW